MTWQLLLAILIVCNIFSIIWTKVLADAMPKCGVNIFYLFLLSAMASLLYAIFDERLEYSPETLYICLIGCINSFGNYFFWKASKISLSKTSLFLPLIDVVAIIMALIFLHETHETSMKGICGAILCFCSIWLFRPSYQRGDGMTLQWFYSMAIVIIIAGIGTFLLKVISHSFSDGTFILGWYAGSFVGSIIILFLLKENPLQITFRGVCAILPLSIAIFGVMLTLYKIFQYGALLSVALPIKGIASTILPVFAGWFFFQENKKMQRKDYIAFGIGVIGTLLIIFR